jgi:hypothetical protein
VQASRRLAQWPICNLFSLSPLSRAEDVRCGGFEMRARSVQSEKDASSCKSRDIAPDGKQTVNVEICIFSNCPIPYRRGTDTQAHGISI